jgi:hypothetical protein
LPNGENDPAMMPSTIPAHVNGANEDNRNHCHGVCHSDHLRGVVARHPSTVIFILWTDTLRQ